MDRLGAARTGQALRGKRVAHSLSGFPGCLCDHSARKGEAGPGVDGHGFDRFVMARIGKRLADWEQSACRLFMQPHGTASLGAPRQGQERRDKATIF